MSYLEAVDYIHKMHEMKKQKQKKNNIKVISNLPLR